MSLLIVFAHPEPPHSRINAALLNAARQVPAVTITDLYAAYPDYVIDVAAEQQRLLAHDTIVLQHPLYWYSVPALLKHWIDQVLTRGWAYGPGGDRLRGKRWGHALSSGGQPESYRPEGLHRHTLNDFLLPLERTATLCGMRWLTPFATQGAEHLDEQALAQASDHYARWLASICLPATAD